MRTLLGDAFALFVYPGLLTCALYGAAAETLFYRAPAPWRAWARARPAGLAVVAALAAALALGETAVPLNQLDTTDRNVLVGAFAVVTIAALAATAAPHRQARLLLVGSGAWAVALLTPAALAQDLHPGVLAGLAFSPALPVKAAAAVACAAGAALLAAGAEEPLRAWLWLPVAALFASVFLPVGGDDAVGLLIFAAVAIVFSTITFAAGLVVRRTLGAEEP